MGPEYGQGFPWQSVDREGTVLSYLEIALINALMIVPLAILTESARRIFRRPALTHLLWVLILVKLLMPPIWHIPLINREWLVSIAQQLVPPVLVEVNSMELRQRLAGISDDSLNEVKSRPRPRTLAQQNPRSAPRKTTLKSVFQRSIRSENIRMLVLAVLLNVWALGALAWFVVQGMRCIRFRWSLRHGSAAGPELQRFADNLARRMGLANSPTVWLMPGVMSPMLWGSGHSLLLIFPELLLDRLDEDATATLLTHELAHCRRRDHLVRVLALLTTGFFWWHPVVWWARREIEAAEEECCDAVVVTIAPAAPKRYAEAILEVVDFLAELELRMPALATGLGQVPFLRQRLTWIMRGPRRQDLGYCGQLLCILLVCLLPLQPSWASSPRTDSSTRLGSIAPVADQRQANSVDPRIVGQIETAAVDRSSFQPEAKEKTQEPRDIRQGLEVRAHSSGGRFVVFGSKQIQCLVDFEDGREFDLIEYGVHALSFSRDAKEFVTIGTDGYLRLWLSETFEVRCERQVPSDWAKSIDISSDGQWIVTGGQDGIVRIWPRLLNEPFHELPRELSPVNCVRFSHSQNRLAVATGDWKTAQTGRIALFDTTTWLEQISMNWNSPSAAVAFHPDGRTLISGDWQGRVARWDIATGELLGLSQGHKDLMASAEFTSSGSPLTEIDIPNLPVDVNWDESETTEAPLWNLNAWGLNAISNTLSSPKSRSR